MAKCFISEKEVHSFQYVRFSEAGSGGRHLIARFDQLSKVPGELPEDFAEPITIRWNPGRESDKLGLEGHRRLSSNPRMRALPGLVRASCSREELRGKLEQFVEARARLLNP